MQVANITLQMSIESLLTEDQDMTNRPASDDQPPQATAPYWLPSPANSHIQAKQNDQHQGAIPKTYHPKLEGKCTCWYTESTEKIRQG